MAGFVMFSHCKLLQAQSRAVAKAEHEDQPSNGDAAGVVCRSHESSSTRSTHSAFAFMHCACVTHCKLLCHTHVLPLHSCRWYREAGIAEQRTVAVGSR